MRLFKVAIRHQVNGVTVVSRGELLAASATDAALWMLRQIKPVGLAGAGARAS